MDPDQKLYLDILNRLPIERITKHPNILVAAGFWDEERFQAARTCYAFMRKIDDFIDDYKANHHRIEEKDRKKFTGQVDKWLGNIRENHRPGIFQKELVKTIHQFRIPIWPIEDFARSSSSGRSRSASTATGCSASDGCRKKRPAVPMLSSAPPPRWPSNCVACRASTTWCAGS